MLGLPIKFIDCPPGLFMTVGPSGTDFSLGLKTEYRTKDGNPEAYTSSGEAWWGGVNTQAERDNILVFPVVGDLLAEVQRLQDLLS